MNRSVNSPWGKVIIDVTHSYERRYEAFHFLGLRLQNLDAWFGVQSDETVAAIRRPAAPHYARGKPEFLRHNWWSTIVRQRLPTFRDVCACLAPNAKAWGKKGSAPTSSIRRMPSRRIPKDESSSATAATIA